jgi:preprotein translocase subunit YajC
LEGAILHTILPQLLAQVTRPTTGPVQRPWFAAFFDNTGLWFMVLVIVFLYVFMIRSKRTQDRRRQEQLNALKKGDRIRTIGGILGTVVDVADDVVVVKVDETSNTKLRFVRSAIHVVESDKSSGAQK